MGKYLQNHPEIKEVFCLTCKDVKPAKEMKTRFKCCDCYYGVRRKYMVDYRKLRALKAGQQLRPKQGRPNNVWTMAKKAEVCEQYIGHDKSIAQLSKIYNTNHSQISAIISKYFGFGSSPVIINIDFSITDDIEAEP